MNQVNELNDEIDIKDLVFTLWKGKISASAVSSSTTGENKSFAAPEAINILSPAVRFPDNAPSEVSASPRLS